MNTKQVIVLRKDLNMRKGKMVAQGAHASMKAILDTTVPVQTVAIPKNHFLAIPITPEIEGWLKYKFTKVCVGVNSEEELLDVYARAKEAGLLCSLIQDAGLTEFGGIPTYTAVAVGPAKVEDIDNITGNLKLL